VICDSTVGSLYGQQVASAIAAFRPCQLITFPAGEWNKTREEWQSLSDALLAAGFGRDAAVVALGGGVTGDLAGFVAATYLRGVPYIQVPTTLLAMIDSSIGGKTGVDTPHGKNLIGAFHQPRAVVADVATLKSLPKIHLAAGVAEALKHGAIADEEYFRWIVDAREQIFQKETATLAEAVSRSVRIKSEVVAADEREAGIRSILNFGHTIAHAIEAVSGYEVLHGEAVATGMVVEARLGTRLGITDAGTTDVIREAVMAFDLPIDPPDRPIHTYLEAMQRDKKTRGGTVRFAFLERLGKVARENTENWTTGATPKAIEEALEP
jgi:3-dehydroquinate synthase